MRALSSIETKMKIPAYDYTPAPGWSYSRIKMLRQCPRRYWYHYYGSRYGNSMLSKEIANIKNKTSIPLEVGSSIHEAIAQSLKRVINNGDDIPKEYLFFQGKKILKNRMETKRFTEEKNGTGLNEYQCSAAYERLEKSLENLVSHPLLHEIITSLTERPDYCIVDPPGYGEYRVDGQKAYAKPDLIYLNSKNQFTVLDWKTGHANTKENLLQLGGYIYYAIHALNQPVTSMQGRMVYLFDKQDDLLFIPTPEHLAKFKNRILDEMTMIEKYCIDAQNNIPQPMENFSKRRGVHCVYCKYKDICTEET